MSAIAKDIVVQERPSKAPPAYLVAQGTLLDPATFHTYAQQVPQTLTQFGGHFLVSGGKVEALEGDPPKFSVIIAFGSMEKANAWFQGYYAAFIRDPDGSHRGSDVLAGLAFTTSACAAGLAAWPLHDGRLDARLPSNRRGFD
jgi:uncharacterized protein (DUF1330 family)